MSKYSVHIVADGSTNYARDYVACNSLNAAKDAARELLRATDGRSATVDVYPYDARDDAYLCHGDYPLRRYAAYRDQWSDTIRITDEVI